MVTWCSCITSNNADWTLAGAVDLIGQEEVAEHRAQLGFEPALVGPPDAGADQIRGDQVGVNWIRWNSRPTPGPRWRWCGSWPTPGPPPTADGRSNNATRTRSSIPLGPQ